MSNSSFEHLSKYVSEILTSDNLNPSTLNKLKKAIMHHYKLDHFPKNYEILEYIPKELRDQLADKLRVKPVRTISGVAVISVMTAPMPCPGRCIYCPGGIDSKTPSPKAYTGDEPAARRAAQLGYDPFAQVTHRIRQLKKMGHLPEKVEIIVMGGTFISLPRSYRDEFIKGIYEGLLGRRYPNKSIDELQVLLEHARYRLVGLTIETRPDFCKEKHVDEMLRYGATRIEIGVQTTKDNILEFIKRGHDSSETKKAFRIAKDSAFKIVAHIMPNLPHSSPEEDLEVLLELIEDPEYRPDMLKIYPTAVIEGTELYEMWKKGQYEPYSEKDLVKVIGEFKRKIPPWIRIQRIQRDIPLYHVDAGYKVGNLRQVVYEYMQERNWVCRCIRCREAGHQYLKYGKKARKEDLRLLVRNYEASGGQEYFISLEDVKQDILVGFLRLRLPYSPHRPEIDNNTALIRELHVYGSLVPIGFSLENSWQHRGVGSTLLNFAEKLALEQLDAKKILVISGIGVREYYRRFGYKREGPYMSKVIM